MSPRFVAALACLLVVPLASCSRSATQLVVEVESDIVSPSYRCVRVEVERVPADLAEAASSAYPRALTPVPFSLGVVPPDGDATARVQIVAETRTDDCEPREASEAAPYVRRVVRTGFLPDRGIRVPIFLAERCAGVVCDPDETCAPDTGLCEPVPFLDPSLLAGELDTGTASELDAAVADAPLPDAPGLDAPVPDAPGATDTGPRPDAPLPDAGAVCATTATMVGMRTTGGTLSGFALATSPTDPSVGLRAILTMGGGADQAAAEAIGAAPNGSDYTGPPPSITGPTSVTFTRDGTAGMMMFNLGGLVAYALYGFSMDARLGGRCPSTRCVIGMGSEFAVLQGPTNLTLSEITVAPRGRGAEGTVTASAPIAMGTTAGGVRPASVGALISWSSGGACRLEHWTGFTAAAAGLDVPDCTQLDMAALDAGGVGVAWTSADGAVHVAVTDDALTSLVGAAVLDATQSATQPLFVASTVRGFRVTWVDDLATPLLRSVPLDATGTPLGTECVVGSGDTLADYRLFQTVRRAGTSAIEWPRGTAYWGTTFTD